MRPVDSSDINTPLWLQQKKRIVDIASSFCVERVGFACLQNIEHPLTARFSAGISLMAALDPEIVEKLDQNESNFHNHILEQRDDLDMAKDAIANLLADWGIDCYRIRAGQDELSLIGEFSHKAVAVNSGLGWIGKSSLLVSPIFGPRVIFRSLLTEPFFLKESSYLSPRCGKCQACVDSCPAGAIRGRNWAIGLDRNELIDAQKCNQFRKNLSPHLRRKHSCSLCMKVCPIGR